MTADQLNQLISVLASITLFELMATIGLGVTVAEVAGVAKNWRLVGRAALASYVLVPAAAAGLLLLYQPHPLVAAGFLIAAVCPGAPYGPPFTGLARGNVVESVGLMVILAASSAVAAPVLLAILLPLTADGAPVHVDAGRMVGTLLVTQFLPLCVGLAVRQWRPGWAARLKRPASLLSAALNAATLGVLIAVQFDLLIGIPVKGYVGMLALVAAAVAAGWLLGGPGRDSRTAMVMATSVRNVGVSLVIAADGFPGTPAVTAATAFAIFQTVVMALVALGWGRLASAVTAGMPVRASFNEGVANGATP